MSLGVNDSFNPQLPLIVTQVTNRDEFIKNGTRCPLGIPFSNSGYKQLKILLSSPSANHIIEIVG
ncbi:MAG: hypothetical protein ACJ8CQ_17795, partial [Microvirga sp.]